MEVLIIGVTGAVGSSLARRLLADGHTVRGLSRHAPDLSRHPELADVTFHAGDVSTGAGLERALDGIDVAYYLVHSMEAAAGADFPEVERRSAEHYAERARAAGVRRTMFLGGPMPKDTELSPHLASRLSVEKLVSEATAESVAFRASIVIGANSRSFRFLVRLIERMPVLVLPAWRDHRTAPVDERDVIAFLLAGASAPDIKHESLDIAGEDTLSYRQLIERIRDLMMVGRPTIGLPGLTLTPIASRISALIAGEDPAFIEPLMESLDSDLLVHGDRAAELLGVRRHSLNSAIEAALRNWERNENLVAR